ncbi:MAG: shikimate dehydrogenase, partial [Solirubrobacteraceae bacterium]
THTRAQALVAELGGRAVERPEPAQLLVNCTAAGLEDQSATFKHLPFGADEVGEFAFVVDLVYTSSGDTALITAATRSGSVTVDGLEVLVHQGALSFTAWTGCAAPIAAMREGARGH